MIADEMFAEQLIEIFAEEIDEVLQQITSKLAIWRNGFADVHALKEIRRGFHTIKGSGRMVQAEQMAELAWAVENMLNHVLDQSISANAAMLALLDQVLEAMPTLLSAFKNKQAAALAGVNVGLLIEQASLLRQGKPVEALQNANQQPQLEDDLPLQSVLQGQVDNSATESLRLACQDLGNKVERLQREQKELRALLQTLHAKQASPSKEAIHTFIEQRLEQYSNEVKELRYFARVNGEKLTTRLQDTQNRLNEKFNVELGQVRNQRQSEQQQQQLALQQLVSRLHTKAMLWSIGSSICCALLTFAAVKYFI